MLSAIAKQAANNVTSETGKSDTLSALAQEAANNVTLEGESSSSPYLVPSPSLYISYMHVGSFIDLVP